ncbi:MAG TPA: glycosyl transferase family 36 [Ignavibacteriales bacterium]|nr:glycosyl transferase family 36 [Ignavibacteriales bacterium]
MSKKLFPNDYGYFDIEGNEYVITNPRTPRPWFNYMWNENYAGLISHTGGGFSYYITPRDNRLTRMRYNCLPWDRPGRYVMVKDSDNKKYFSLSWAPTIDINYDFYECRHGQGYTKISTQYNEIYGEILYFVPLDVDAEIWTVKIKNLSDKKRKLEIYSFVELLMGNALNDLINQPNDKHFTDIIFNKETQTLEATRRYWVLNKKVSVAQPNIDWRYKIYFKSTLPVSGFDGSLDNFIGRWRSEANPESVESGIMKNTEITAGDPIAALQNIIEIEPQQTVEFAIIMAIVSKDIDKPYEHLDWNNLIKIETLDKKFNDLKSYWKDYLSHVQVETPSEEMNLMVNIWNQYQAAVTFDMARNSGYYHGGLLFGTGMRDQFQDILGMVITHPERVRKRLLNALRFQFSDGSTLHNFFKITNWGEKTNHSDTPLWIPFGIIEYLNETGDFTILDEMVEFYDNGIADVYTHMKRAIDFCLSATTQRGLPKIMNGDWNDTLDHIGPQGKGETVWGGMFLAYNILKTFDLLKYRKDYDTLQRWQVEYDKLKDVINKYCWDGEWWIRAFRDNGEPVGTHLHDQGKIFINSQTWSVLSDVADEERARKSMESLKKYLLRDKGVQICWPSFTKVDDSIGLISRCVPGKKENGAIFNHASSWAVLALLEIGDIDLAVDIYHRMLPINSAKNIDRYEVEPYVFAEYVTSPDHPTEGQASHSWLTGTAVWMLRIATDHILGFKTNLDGFIIDPKIPKHWKELKYTRKFRGKTFNIYIKNPNNKNIGVSSLIINGEKFNSNEVKLSNISSEIVNIEATIE